MENYNREQMLHTDLALEVREKFEDDVEVSGVVLKKDSFCDNQILITTVEIINEHGCQVMNKPKGTYITIEAPGMNENKKISDEMTDYLTKELKKLDDKFMLEKVLVAGLGNREVTPDMLGPLVTDNLCITRHIYNEFGENAFGRERPLKVCAISPGVMAQTGMESSKLIKGLISEIEADCIFVIDALAARSVSRLNTTIQITDTGICPGSGVGNHRKAINSTTMGVPVIAIGVPTVVDAFTIINDSMEEYLSGTGMSEKEISAFMNDFSVSEAKNMIVSPKNIDESVVVMAKVIAEAMNRVFYDRHKMD